jgi:hypothetical protein
LGAPANHNKKDKFLFSKNVLVYIIKPTFDFAAIKHSTGVTMASLLIGGISTRQGGLEGVPEHDVARTRRVAA